MSVRLALASLLCAAVWQALSCAAGQVPADANSPAAGTSAAKAPAADTPAAEAPAQAAPTAAEAAASFKQAFDEFKQVLGKLRSLQSRFQVAADSDRPQLAAQFNEYIAKGAVIVPRLQAAAVTAFQADSKDRAAGEFLMANLVDAVESDRYADGARLAKILAAGGYSEKGFANYAGIAEFCHNDFAQAKIDLVKALQENAINKVGKEHCLPNVDECEQLWKTEKELRDAEQQADDLPRVRLTTTKGDIVVELFENEAPNTTANFISLVENHFYDGLKFHQVVSGRMAQTGSPNGNNTGGPGYSIPCEGNQENSRKHFAGSLSMALAGPNTGGSQFYLMFAPAPGMNGKHTVFGRVIEGLDVLASLQRMDPDHPNPFAQPDEIVKAIVLRKRDHAYEPQKNETPKNESPKSETPKPAP